MASLGLLCLFPVTALAQDAPSDAVLGNANDPDAAVAYLGGTILYTSEYLGSADEEFRVLPNLSVYNFKGFDFAALALSYDLVDIGGGEGFGQWSLRLGPRVGYQFGRDSDDSDTLTGLEDVDGSLVTGGFVRASYGPVGVRLNAGQDIIGGHDGFVVDASVGTQLPLGKFVIQPSVSLNWADGNHNQSFFGITPEQAAITGLDSNAVGWVDIGEWQASASFSYRRFIEDSLDSPIINAPDGSRNGIFSNISLTRKFDLSKY